MRFLYVFAVLALSLLACGPAMAQQTGGDSFVSVKMDVRFDGEVNGYGKDDSGERPSADAGFVGRYLKLLVDGKITDKFTYSFTCCTVTLALEDVTVFKYNVHFFHKITLYI